MVDIEILIRVGEGGEYIAQCVQYDICAQGPTSDEALYAFCETVLLHNGRLSLSDIPATPPAVVDEIRGRANS